MPTNPSEKVQTSTQLWSEQVGIVNATEGDDMANRDFSPGGSPVIYPFNRNGKRGFEAPKDPYI